MIVFVTYILSFVLNVFWEGGISYLQEGISYLWMSIVQTIKQVVPILYFRENPQSATGEISTGWSMVFTKYPPNAILLCFFVSICVSVKVRWLLKVLLNFRWTENREQLTNLFYLGTQKMYTTNFLLQPKMHSNR